MAEKVKIAFAEEEGTVETLWAAVVGDGCYRLKNVPFFFYGVSLGDLVEARWREEDLEDRDDEDDEDYGFPYFTRVLEKSGNRTLRLGFARNTAEFVPVCTVQDPQAKEILGQLSDLGCAFETFHPYLVSINVPPETDLDRVMSFLDSTDLKWENGDPAWEEIPGRPIYRMETADTGEDQVGGVPPGVTKELWPTCDDCGQPQTFVMLLERHPERLRLSRFAAVALFRCLRHEPTDEAPRVAARSAVLLLERGQLSGKAWKPEDVESLPLSRLVYTKDHEPNPWAAGATALGEPTVNKIGGYPRWCGVERTPYCPQCGTPMALVAQLGSFVIPALSDVSYLFVCPSEHGGWLVAL